MVLSGELDGSSTAAAAGDGSEGISKGKRVPLTERRLPGVAEEAAEEAAVGAESSLLEQAAGFKSASHTKLPLLTRRDLHLALDSGEELWRKAAAAAAATTFSSSSSSLL